MLKPKQTFIICVFCFSFIFTGKALAVDTKNWDIYYGVKGGLGYGGAMLEVGLIDISPNDYSYGTTKQDKRGKLVFHTGFGANFIIRDNWGMEYELLYRRAGERVHDVDGGKHSLNLHYIDLNAIGKYWLFGKLLSAGVGFVFSFLTYAEIDDHDIMYNVNRFDLSAIIKINFNYWALKERVLFSMEISIIAGVLNVLKNDANFNNIGVYISFGIYYLHKTVGVQLNNFRY